MHSINPQFHCDFNQLKSVLIRPIGDAVGDAVAHCAHLRQLKQAFPHIRTGCFVTQRNRAVIQLAGVADELLEDTPETYLAHRNRWDLVIDFFETFYPATFVSDLALNAPIIAIPKHYNPQLANIPANICFCPPSTDVHIRDYLKQSIIGSYLNTDAVFYLPPNPNTPFLAEKIWQPNKLRVLLSPVGSCHYIPPNEFAEIVNAISDDIAPYLDLVFGRSAVAEDYWKLFQPMCRYSTRLAESTTLEQFLSLVESSNMVISVDTGTVHLACAYARPIVAFYGNHRETLNMWMPSPHSNTPTLLSISTIAAPHPNVTQQFNIPEMAVWLNAQLRHLLTR